VRTGCPAIAVNQEHIGAPFFSAFADSLFPLSFPAAQALAQRLQGPPVADAFRVLDIGAGAAVWSIPIAQQIPSARVTAVDWPQVLNEVTSRFVQSYGLASRYEMLPGDILEVNYGHGYDLAIVGLLLHTEGETRSKAVLSKIYDAIAPGGKVVIVEFLVDRDRKESLDGLLFALNMLVHSESGTTWSYDELAGWLQDAGFHDVTAIKLPRPSPVIVGQKPNLAKSKQSHN
jgi:SAM-dependent methyltransferase